ncbi:MAG: type I methionyl aminopeptidase [bacterium]|nr:type I methionyl aminopeptidase [bacterium]
MSVVLKSSAEIALMRKANLVVYDVLSHLRELVRPGITTIRLDGVARELCEKAGAKPAFLGYPSGHSGVAAFPGTICASVNQAIVHGIPDDRPLEEGDIVSIDFGCSIGGYFGDSATTVAVGEVDTKTAKLLEVTERSLYEAIKQCYPGKRLGDIGNAVQTLVEANGFGIVKEFVGHGIGSSMHEPPHVPNYGSAGTGRLLRAGMVLAIEPMVTMGNPGAKILSDGWTAVTKDGSLAAHFEHTVAITDCGPVVLSRPV